MSSRLAILTVISAALLGQTALAQAPGGPAGAGAAGAPAPRRGPVLPVAPGGAMPSETSPGYRPQSVVNGVQVTLPQYEDVFATLDALPNAAPARPKQARKVLVYSRPKGFMHSSIPLTAFAIKALGDKTGAWSTDVSYKLEDFTAANLARYDVLVLNSTTGEFLDDADAAATAARHAALLSYVRAGHGLVLTHAGTDAYHTNGNTPAGLKSTWPEFTVMTGGFFKFHWLYPQEITVKIDDSRSPLNATLAGRPFTVHDEIYTLAQDSFSRKNAHVLTSIDYSKMSEKDKEVETAATRRTDGDYAISWIRREGKGRVYSNVLGHSEHVLAMPSFLAQLTAGIQYAAGDLAADDSPSAR